jgi:hypothetical protein
MALPLDTPLVDMVDPAFADLLTETAKTATKNDLIVLMNHHAFRDQIDLLGTRQFLPLTVALNYEDIRSIEDAFHGHLIASLSTNLRDGGDCCCCSIVCCCTAASVAKPERMP